MKVLLDTNLWSYIGDQSAGHELDRLLASMNHTLVLAPAVLLEAMKTPRGDVRHRVLKAMVSARGEHLRSDADLESDEVINEVRRLHPEWLRQVPNRPLVTHYRMFWTKDIWRHAVDNADAGAQHLERSLIPNIDTLLRVQRENQAAIQRDLVPLPANFLDQTARPSPASEAMLPGWDGQAEVWRVNTAFRLQRSLQKLPAAHQSSTEADWVGSFVDLKKMYADRELANRFFLEEISQNQMRRNWLHNFAIETGQLALKITNGNPIDQQLSVHLLDCDVLLTGDKRFHTVVSSIREQVDMGIAPTALAVRADLDAIACIAQTLERTPTR